MVSKRTAGGWGVVLTFLAGLIGCRPENPLGITPEPTPDFTPTSVPSDKLNVPDTTASGLSLFNENGELDLTGLSILSLMYDESNEHITGLRFRASSGRAGTDSPVTDNVYFSGLTESDAATLVIRYTDLDGRDQTLEVPLDAIGIEGNGVRTMEQLMARNQSRVPTADENVVAMNSDRPMPGHLKHLSVAEQIAYRGGRA